MLIDGYDEENVVWKQNRSSYNIELEMGTHGLKKNNPVQEIKDTS